MAMVAVALVLYGAIKFLSWTFSSSGHCSHPDPICIQIRWSLQSPGSSTYPAQMVEQHLERTSIALNVSGDHVN